MESIAVSTGNLGRNPRSIYHGLTQRQIKLVKKIERDQNITNPEDIMIIIKRVKKEYH